MNEQTPNEVPETTKSPRSLKKYAIATVATLAGAAGAYALFKKGGDIELPNPLDNSSE